LVEIGLVVVSENCFIHLALDIPPEAHIWLCHLQGTMSEVDRRCPSQ
jgi:hypothetical protein